MSSLVLSQVTLTNPSKVEGLFIPKSQVDQVAKGLQQNEFLKTRLISAEKTLSKANETIKAHEKDSEIDQKMINEQNKLITSLKNENLKLEEIHLSELKSLNAEIKLIKESATKTGRKKFWSGLTTGTVIGVAGALVTIIAIR